MLTKAALLLFLLMPTGLWAQSLIPLEITVNEKTWQTEALFSKLNSFTVIIPVSEEIHHPWNFRVTSPFLPQEYLKATFSRGEIMVSLEYWDPLFHPINFESLTIYEVKLLLENENTETAVSVFSVLTKKLRTDIWSLSLTSLEPDHLKSLENVFLSGIFHFHEVYSASIGRELATKAQLAEIFSEDKIEIIFMCMGLRSVTDIKIMKGKLLASPELELFLFSMREISPTNRILNFLLD